MKKRVINEGDKISATKRFGEKVLNVDSKRTVGEETTYYVSGEGLRGVHAVKESEVEDHATAEEYEKYMSKKAPTSGEDEDEEEGNEAESETTLSNPVTSSTPVSGSEEGNGSSTSETTSSDSTLSSSDPTNLEGEEGNGTDGELTGGSCSPTQPTIQDSSTGPNPSKNNSGNKQQKRRV